MQSLQGAIPLILKEILGGISINKAGQSNLSCFVITEYKQRPELNARVFFCYQKEGGAVYSRYDKPNDILYLKLRKPISTMYADDGPSGIEVMKEADTDDIVGFIVYAAQRNIAQAEKNLLSLGYDIKIASLLVPPEQ